MLFKNKTKQKILEVLRKEWPLSLSEIKRKGNFCVSYQYIKQCVDDMYEEGILEKKGFTFSLRKKWLEGVLGFVQGSLRNYQLGYGSGVFDRNDTQVRVESLYELGHFMLEALEGRFLEKKSKEGFFCLLNHLWIPFSDKEKQERLKNIGKREKFSVVYVKNGKLDSFLRKRCYEKYFDRVTGVRDVGEEECDVFVYGDCVIQIYLPLALVKSMDRLYDLSKNPFLLVSDLFEMTYKKHNIHLVITRNKEVAKKYKEKINGYF